MGEDSSNNSPLIRNVRQAIRGPKAVAVTWGDEQVSVVCLWNEVDLPPSEFDTHSVAVEGDDVAVVPKIRVLADMTGITWPDHGVIVTAVRLAELAEAQGVDPLPPAVFSTWKASLGLDTEGAAKHLNAKLEDVSGYEAGTLPIPRMVALLCREWLAGEETAYEKDWAWDNYIRLRENVDRAYEAYKANKNKNKGLSEAAHILEWIDGKRHSEKSIHFSPWLYFQLLKGYNGPPLGKVEAVERIRQVYNYPSWEAARKDLARRIKTLKGRYPDDTTYEGILPPTWPSTKNS